MMHESHKCQAGMHVRVLLTPIRFEQPMIRGYALITRVHEPKVDNRADSDESWQASEALLKR